MEPTVRMRETVDLKSYAQLLWRRKWFVIAPTVLAALVGWFITMPRFMPKVYQCSSTLLVEAPKPLSKELQGIVAAPGIGERIERLENQIQSNDFLKKIIENTGMRDDEQTQQWAERNQGKFPDLSTEELVDHKLMRYLRQSIRMSPKGKSRNQIQVAVMDFYPDRAYRLVQNLNAAILEANRSSQLEDLQSTENFSNVQLNDYKRKLQDAEGKLESYRKNLATRDVTPTLVTTANMSQAEEGRRRAQEDLSSYQGEAARSRSRLTSAGVAVSDVERVLTSSEIDLMMREGRELEHTYVRERLLQGETGTGQSTAIRLSRLVEEIAAKITGALGSAGLTGPALEAVGNYVTARVRADFASARAVTYDQLIAEFRGRATSGPLADLELTRLESEVALYRSLHDVFVKQITQSQISSAFESSNVGDRISVIEPPQRPFSPVKPRRTYIVAIAVIAGLSLGVFGAFVLEHHDQSFRDVKETEARLGIRVVGTIPGMEDIAKAARAVKDAGEERSGEVLEAFGRFLDDTPGYQEFRRTALALLRVGNEGPRSVLVTSARSGEGKSTASTCLALTMAKELARERIILVDMDIRKPALARSLGLRIDGSDTGQILQSREWDELAPRNLLLPNLFLLPMRLHADQPDVITQESVRWLLGELRPRFDRIVIDSPPNLPVTDPLIIGPEVEAVLMVVKAGATPRETVQRSLEIQRQFCDNVWGVLMNNVSDALPYYYSYRHYGYGYAKKSARG